MSFPGLVIYFSKYVAFHSFILDSLESLFYLKKNLNERLKFEHYKKTFAVKNSKINLLLLASMTEWEERPPREL